MTIILLMAGSSEAFRAAGHLYPKALVEVDGMPVVQHVLQSLASLTARGDQIVALVQKDEAARFHLDDVIRLLVPNARVAEVLGDTAGAACTALLAIEHIQDEEPLVVLNGDQILQCNVAHLIDGFAAAGLDGGIPVFRDVHPRWSFVKCNKEGFVIEAAEKRPISNLATAGLYYFRRGDDFVTSATEMIRKDAQVNGHFFVCPVYNEMILRQKHIGVAEIPKSAYWSLASPQGVREYEEHVRQETKR